MYLISNDKYKLPYLIVLFLVISFLDILGLGLIAPYIEILTGQEGVYFQRVDGALKSSDINLSNKDTIILISIALIIVFFIKSVGNILLSWLILRFVHSKEVSLRFELIKSYYNHNYEDMISNRSSDSIENIISLVPFFVFNTFQPLLKIISDLIICLAIITFLLFSVGNISLLLLIFLILIVLTYNKIFANRMISYGKKSSQGQKAIIKSVQETLSGLKEIKILNKETFFTNEVFKGAREYANNKIKISLINTSPSFVFEFLIITCMTVFIMIYVSIKGTNIINLLPVLGMLALAIFRMVPKAGTISSDIVKINSGKYATGKIYDILSYNETTKRFKNKNIPNTDDEFKSLKLRGIKYKYPGTEKYVFKGINLDIKKGEQIGIRGSSGSGKTTLIDIVLGHLEPTEGQIYFNNNPLNKANYYKFLDIASYIPQEVFLIDDTLKKNITLSQTSLFKDEKLSDAIEKANLSEFVESLDLKYDAIVGEGGINLSGGQRQRIAIARSFYHSRNFIIFDESTSSLDPITESKIIKEISKLSNNNTIIIISHRNETLENCNRIFEINNGELEVVR
tara:strand:+ start:2934 stop:4643 length:1710 start_codon:yes stop_codon:yes gene_type:complete